MTSFFLLSFWNWAVSELLANLFSVYINIYVCAVNNICCSHQNKFTALGKFNSDEANLTLDSEFSGAAYLLL